MDANRNLLVGALALQTGLIDSRQFAEVSKAWGAQPEKAVADMLVERGWITAKDSPHLDFLVQRLLDQHHGDPRASLRAQLSIVKKCLAALEELDADSTVYGSSGPISVAPASSKIGDPPRDSRYTFMNVHAAGGIGRVWLARDRHLDREVAIKELRPESAGDRKIAARFLREAQLTSQLQHPGIVPVYELASRPDTNEPFYTMRLVHGRTLTDALESYHTRRAAGTDEPLAFVVLLTAFVAVCNTIAYAHSRGVIHRDLKGDNVLLGDYGEVIVLDWGLAKFVGQPDEVAKATSASTDTPADPNLTMQGEIVGTPAFMSPEQAEGRLDDVDQRTDIFGLGAILYAILTGRSPFAGATTLAVLLKAAQSTLTPPREIWPEVPAALEAITLKAMARDPDQRHANAADLAHEVQVWQEAQRRQAEDALRRQSEVLRSVLNLIPGVVWTARPDGNIDYANQTWTNFTGLTLEETLGSGWVRMVHPDDVARVTQVWAQALETGEPVEVDYRVKRGVDGAYRWFLAQSRPVRDRDGHIVKWFGILTEIEEHKQGEQALERQNKLVRLLHQVTVAAYEADTFAQALQAGIDQVCAFTGWPVGHVYVVAGDGSKELTPTSIWHLDRPDEFKSFVRITSQTRLAVGAGLPGRVVANKQPAWIMDVTTDENFPRAKAAANLGVKGAFGFPVLTGDGVVAVLEFFTSQPKEPDEVLLAAMAQIGLQLGQVYERKRTEAELKLARDAIAAAKHQA